MKPVSAMTEKDQLLAAVRESPTDDTARLVFADWCEENNQSDRAAFIRAQIRLNQIGPPRELYDGPLRHHGKNYFTGYVDVHNQHKIGERIDWTDERLFSTHKKRKRKYHGLRIAKLEADDPAGFTQCATLVLDDHSIPYPHAEVARLADLCNGLISQQWPSLVDWAPSFYFPPVRPILVYQMNSFRGVHYLLRAGAPVPEVPPSRDTFVFDLEGQPFLGMMNFVNAFDLGFQRGFISECAIYTELHRFSLLQAILKYCPLTSCRLQDLFNPPGDRDSWHHVLEHYRKTFPQVPPDGWKSIGGPLPKEVPPPTPKT